MPPPPPPRKSGNGAVIALVAIVGVVVLGGGCATCLCLGARAAARREKERDEASASADPAPTATAKPPKPAPTTNDNWITAERPYIKFLAPPGWSTTITQDKEWGIFKSPKKDAVLTFTTFSRPGESTVRLGRAASVLGVTDIQWGTPRVTTVGKEHFDAHSADGTCNFEGPGGYVWYATVNTGSSDQILLIFTVSPRSPRARRMEAQAAIDSLQRR